MSSFNSYYYEENEEREEEEEWADDTEIHRTVHHLVEEIVEECENWSAPSSPAPSLPEMPQHFENWPTNQRNSLRKTPSTISSQSAEMEFSSEENEEGMGEEEGSSHFPVVLAKQPPSYEEVAKRFRSMRKLAQQREGTEQKSNLPGPSNSPPFARHQEIMQGKMPEILANSEGIEMASLERGKPKLGSGRKIGPAELAKNQNLRKIDKNVEEEERRPPKMSGPRRAFLLFCATLLSLILSSLIVIFVLISFNPNR